MRGDLIRRGVFPFSSQLLGEKARHLAPLDGRLVFFLNLSLHFRLDLHSFSRRDLLDVARCGDPTRRIHKRSCKNPLLRDSVLRRREAP